MATAIVSTLLGLASVAAAQESVPRLIADTLASHPGLRAQHERVQAAAAGVASARWRYWPTPSVSTEHAYSGNDPQYRGDRQTTTLRLQQTLWSGGRLTANLSRAQLREAIQRLDDDALRLALALRVVQAWSDAVSAQSSVRAHELNHRTHLRLFAMVERRVQAGASAPSDLDLAQSRLHSASAELETARLRQETARNNLTLLAGRPAELQSLDGVPPPPAIDEPQSALGQALERNPQIGKAEAQWRLAGAEIATVQASAMPEVYLRVERQSGSYGYPNARPQSRVFLGLSTAFGAGLSNLSDIEAARAEQRAAEQELQSQRLSLEEQVRTDLFLLDASTRRRALLEQARRVNEEVSSSWERQFLADRKQWQDLMNSARDQAMTDTQLADAIGSQQLSAWRLAILTRGLPTVATDLP